MPYLESAGRSANWHNVQSVCSGVHTVALRQDAQKGLNDGRMRKEDVESTLSVGGASEGLRNANQKPVRQVAKAVGLEWARVLARGMDPTTQKEI